MIHYDNICYTTILYNKSTDSNIFSTPPSTWSI
jgi:hypothetical protein